MTTATRPTPSTDSRAYQRWVSRQKGYGRWQPFVDAQPARDHVKHVMATTGMGYRRYAELSGVPRTTLSGLLYGVNGGRPIKRIAPDNERKLLAIQADTAQGLTIPAIGSHRRIHVLIGEGWPQIHLGPRIGTHPQYVWQILHQQRITIATAESVANTYHHLNGLDPREHGVTPHGYALAKKLAARNQWPDRLFWDDLGHIDDPAFDPETAEQPLGRNELAALRREEILHFARFGYEPEMIRQRLGGEVSFETVRAIVREYRTGRKRDRSNKAAA